MSAPRLRDLQQAVAEHIVEIDRLMYGPPSFQRGQAIAQSLTRLQEKLVASGYDLRRKAKPHGLPN